MKVVNILIICWLSIIFSGCKNSKTDERVDVDFNRNLIKEDETTVCHFDSVEMIKGNYSIKVISCFIDDSIPIEEPAPFYPIYVNQVVIIKKKDSVIFAKPHPVEYIYQQTFSNNVIPMMKNYIYNIGIVGEGEDMLFTIDGYGGCNACTEYYSLYNVDGGMEYCYYGETRNVLFQKGNMFKVLKKHNIPDTIYRQQTYPIITTFPKICKKRVRL